MYYVINYVTLSLNTSSHNYVYTEAQAHSLQSSDVLLP